MTHPPQQARVNRQLLLILITVFLNIMGLGLILPVLPFYATAYGADGAHVGLLFTAFAAMQFAASPIFGALSDRFGRRPIILLGVLGQIIAYLLMGFATSLGMLYVSRLFAGLTAGNISATQAYVADVTRPEERTRAYGLVGAAFGAGLLFGPALGGVLTLIDSRAPAFGAAAFLTLNLVFGYFLLSESLPRERRSPRPLRSQINPVGVLIPLVRRPALRAPLLATFLVNAALAGFQANFAVFAGARFDFGPTQVSALFVATGLANILVQLVLIPRLAKRFSDSALVLTGAAAHAAGSVATAFAPVPNALWASLPVMTGGYSLGRGPLTSMVTKLVAPYEQGMANGGIQATVSLAGVVGPLWAGFAFEYLGQGAPYWTGATAVVLGALAIVLRTRSAPVVVPAATPAAGTAPAAYVAPPQPAAPAAVNGLPAAMLQGSLGDLGLVALLQFLSRVGKNGCLELSRDGWSGHVCLEHGRLVAASLGRERGLAALDAILLVLSEARFTFAEAPPPAAGGGEFSIDVDQLAARLPSVPERQRALAGAIPTPTAVPRTVLLAEPDHDSTELVLRIGTLHTLLAVDGERSVQELAGHGTSAQVLVDLAVLMDIGLIQFEPRPTRSGQLIG